jgi:hypothetical protein
MKHTAPIASKRNPKESNLNNQQPICEQGAHKPSSMNSDSSCTRFDKKTAALKCLICRFHTTFAHSNLEVSTLGHNTSPATTIQQRQAATTIQQRQAANETLQVIATPGGECVLKLATTAADLH